MAMEVTRNDVNVTLVDLKYEMEDPRITAVNESDYKVFCGRMAYTGDNKNTEMGHSILVEFLSNQLNIHVVDEQYWSHDGQYKTISFDLKDIEDDAFGYITTINEITWGKGPRDAFRIENLDNARRSFHNNIADFIKTKMNEEGLYALDRRLPYSFARTVITTWFEQVGYCEYMKKIVANRNIGSFSNFYHSAGAAAELPAVLRHT